jgi:hypothetical protein
MEDTVLLARLLSCPVREWESACGMRRPPWWRFWQWGKFAQCVTATRRAIRATLDRDECPPCLPYVDVEVRGGMITVIVRMWGRPWEPADMTLP